MLTSDNQQSRSSAKSWRSCILANYSKPSLTTHIHISITPLYQSLYLGPKMITHVNTIVVIYSPIHFLLNHESPLTML